MTINWFYIELGINHVLDYNALDHLYFLVALTAPFNLKTIKKLIILVTFFTLGHTFSLILSFFYSIPINSIWIEFLIPITIAFTCLPLIFYSNKTISSNYYDLIISLTTIIFGIIHGLGFASFFSKIIIDNASIYNLLEFAIGIEFSQVIIALIVVLFKETALKFLGFSDKKLQFTLGFFIFLLSLKMIYNNQPFF
ncbi:MAG: HupE/UreJ family protein [Flavobacteriaceae bacterium]|nr:HupE/UreJ family protein [Flavobacteriaceae bacterium]